MNANWQLVPFREFLKPNLRPYLLGPLEDAKLVGMRWYGDGPFFRELKPGFDIRKKTHFLIRKGDVMYMKLFAWKGSFGIVPSELDGMLVSDKFPTYELDASRVDPVFLKWYFRRPTLWEQANEKSQGAAAISKHTLNPPQFLNLTILLPETLAEQRRIVARMEAIAGRVAEARRVRAISHELANAIIAAELSHKIDQRNWPSSILSECLIDDSRNGIGTQPVNSPPGVPLLRISAGTSARDFFVEESDHKYLPVPPDSVKNFHLRAGDLLACRFNGNLSFVGRFSLYAAHTGVTQVYPDKLIRFRADPAKLLPLSGDTL